MTTSATSSATTPGSSCASIDAGRVEEPRTKPAEDTVGAKLAAHLREPCVEPRPTSERKIMHMVKIAMTGGGFEQRGPTAMPVLLR